MTEIAFHRVVHPKYKYQLTRDYWHRIPELPTLAGSLTPYIAYDGDVLLIGRGYAWDGPSGPTVDTVDALIASLVHDVLYQLIREGILPSSYRRRADLELYRVARREGMPLWRAAYWYAGLRLFGWSAV